MYNIHSLFFSTNENNDCFYHKLNLHPARKDLLNLAKIEIRSELRSKMPSILQARGHFKQGPTPRFFTQGSWAYKTLNNIAHNGQQIDIDDGCYLPMSFLQTSKRPSVAAEKFFEAAEEALSSLIAKKRWQLVTDKATCVRVIIAQDAHVDIPLYAIPDEEFNKLAEAASQRRMALEAAIGKRDSWTILPTDQVLLAHRKEDWISSDPRPVKEWFWGEVTARGEQLRRIVRYLKAFRDWNWIQGGPSSILLMAASCPIFEQRKNRDDLALYEVVTKLPKVLRNGVLNPVDASESLTSRLGDKGVNDAASHLDSLGKTLKTALYESSSPKEVCQLMRNAFGPRIPDDPRLVQKTSVEETINAAPVFVGASQLVGRTKAG